MIGLSNAIFSPPQPTQASPDFVLNPTSSLNASQFNQYGSNLNPFLQQSDAGTLTFPSDCPKYILTFQSQEYTRSSLNSIGVFKDSGYKSIILPMPQSLINSETVKWQETELGTAAGTFLGGLAAPFTTPGPGQMNSPTSQTVAGQTAVAGLAGLNTATTLTGAGTAGSSVAEAMYGIAPNAFVVLLMRGPTYKRWHFSWICSPTNYKESQTLQQIINTFRNCMSPGVYGAFAGAPVLFTYPKIFRIRAYPNSRYVAKWKPAILNHFVADLTPGSRAAFNANKTGTIGNNPPVAIKMDAFFIETEYWLAGNYTDTNDPDDLYNLEPNNGVFASNADAAIAALQGAANLQQQNTPTITDSGGATGSTAPGGSPF